MTFVLPVPTGAVAGFAFGIPEANLGRIAARNAA